MEPPVVKRMKLHSFEVSTLVVKCASKSVSLEELNSLKMKQCRTGSPGGACYDNP